MPMELLTYAALGERLHCSPEAARALAKRSRLPRQKANDGKVLVSVDLSEISHKPMTARSPGGHRAVTAALEMRVQELQAMVAKLETAAAGHRADFERERHRAEQLMSELLRAMEDAMTARENVARLEGKLIALRVRPWWRRLRRLAG